MDDYFQYVVSLLGASICYFFGEVNGLIRGLIAFAVIDYITGLFKGGKNKTLSSRIGFEGIRRKVTMFLLVGVANILDKELLSGLIGSSELLRDLVIWFYLANEGLSILENAVAIGLPVPEVMKSKLLEFRHKSNGEITEGKTKDARQQAKKNK